MSDAYVEEILKKINLSMEEFENAFRIVFDT